MSTSIFDHPIDPTDREQWRAVIATPLSELHPSGQQSVFVFRVGDEWFGLAPEKITMVAPLPMVHSIPHRRPIVTGVVNVRGTVTLCFSLQIALGSASADNDKTSAMMLVLDHKNWHIAGIIDAALGMVKFNPDEVIPLPATLEADNKHHLSGIITHDGIDIGWIDTDALFATFIEGVR